MSKKYNFEKHSKNLETKFVIHLIVTSILMVVLFVAHVSSTNYAVKAGEDSSVNINILGLLQDVGFLAHFFFMS